MADVRAQLAADSLEEYSTIRGALLDALKAEKDSYVSCPNCKKKHVVTLPDRGARVNAVKTLLEPGFGRPQEPKTALLKDPKAMEEVIREYYKHLGIKPVDEYSFLELHIARVYDLVANPESLADERWEQEVFAHLLRNDSSATINAGIRERGEALRRMAREINDWLGESEEALDEARHRLRKGGGGWTISVCRAHGCS